MFGLAAVKWWRILTGVIHRGARSSLSGPPLFRHAFRLDVLQLHVRLPPGKYGRSGLCPHVSSSDAFSFVSLASGS